jgi:hypothetical protein
MGFNNKRKRISGTWRGSYTWPEDPGKRRPVGFTLKLKQGWFGHFTGVINEDEADGMPGTGVIDGYFGFPSINFVKRMPICYVLSAEGRQIRLQEFLIAQGVDGGHGWAHPPVIYQGSFDELNRAQGIWIINPWFVPLPAGGRMPFSQSSGTWNMDCNTGT